MKRHHFIFSALAIALAPFFSASALKNKNSLLKHKGFKVKEGEGRIHGHIKLKGVNANILDLKISGSDTEGGMAFFQQTSITPGRGTPLHIHQFQDEFFYVIEGKYYFQVGGEKYTLSAGDTIFLPKTVPHAWTQISEKGKMNVLFQPAGKMENFFTKVASLQHEPSKEEMAKIFAENEMEIVGPPLKLKY